MKMLRKAQQARRQAHNMMTANEITNLIGLSRHANDLFVAECKDGPTWGGPHLRLDAWAMNRSWTQLKFSGYEVKVSRNDFVKDDKWREYLPLCNDFWFVCPHGLIDKDELPAEAGLLWVAKTGSRLWIKKKAPTRKLDQPPVSLLLYILMSRVNFAQPGYHDGWDALQWKLWLQTKRENQMLGASVSKELRARVDQEIVKVRSANKRLEAENESLKEVRAWCEHNGVDLSRRLYAYDVDRKLKEVLAAVPPELLGSLERLKESASMAKDRASHALSILRDLDKQVGGGT
jgi:hypothetical protein